MSDLRVCKVLNKFNVSGGEYLVVCSIWENPKLKVYVIKYNSLVFFGEEVNDQLEKYAKTFDKTLDAYLQETKDILCGMKNDIDFFLTDSKFYWKRKKWFLGQISVKPIQDEGCLTRLMFILVDEFLKYKDKLDDVQKHYEGDKVKYSDALHKLNEILILKEQLEDGLYKKFALLLNTKKAKIRNLKDHLKKLEDSNNIFNETTDESESELKEKKYISSHLSKKRAHLKNAKEKLGKKRKKADIISNITEVNFTKNNALVNTSNDIEAVPSTSSKNENLYEDETPDLLSEESECDLELKFDEDKLEDNNSTIIEEDSEEEMF